MPSFLRRGCLVVLCLTCTSFSLYSQTLYFIYSDSLGAEDDIFPSEEIRRNEIRDLISLDLPFLLGTRSFETIAVPVAVKAEFEKMIFSRSQTSSDGEQKSESDSETLFQENFETLPLSESDENRSNDEGDNLSEASSTIEGKRASTDPIFSLLGIEKAADKDALVYVCMKKSRLKTLSDQRIFGEIEFDFYLIHNNQSEIFDSPIRAVGLAETKEKTVEEIQFSLRVALKSTLNSLFGKGGAPYIVNFINTKKVVIAHGRRQGSFPGAFYRIVRQEADVDGETEERVIGRLYVEKCEVDYSFCRILYAEEPPVPGDSIQKIPGVGVHQSIGYDFLISALSISETETETYVNHLLGTRWTINREMPIAKPTFGVEILTGTIDQLDTAKMLKVPLIGNFYAGMQVDRFFHRFSFSPFVDFGIAFSANAATDKKTLTWFTCKAGAKFVWMVHENIGLYLEGGYVSWLGIPGKEAVFEDASYIYYAPNDYTGGFGGIGITLMY